MAAGAGRHAEAHVGRPATPHKVLGAAGGVGPSRQLPPGHLGIVAAVMATLEHLGHAGDGRVQLLQVVLGLVGGGMAGPDHGAENVPGAVEEAEEGIEAEATLVGGAGGFLVLRVDLHQRSILVENRLVPRYARHSAPDFGADLATPSPTAASTSGLSWRKLL